MSVTLPHGRSSLAHPDESGFGARDELDAAVDEPVKAEDSERDEAEHGVNHRHE